MLCASPFIRDGKAHGCGQCHPCRFNRRRIWTHRILLEARQHLQNSFVTLTYSEQNISSLDVGSGPSLEPKHSQDWLKRFRKAIAPLRIRYFLVGEYGDESRRPHYHAALFGYESCLFGRTRGWKQNCCAQCDLVRDTWGYGKVFLGSLEDNSAQYIAGYVTKKLTNANDPGAAEVLAGRHPEFARMSLRPGIGCDAMDEVASTLMTFNLDASQADVPSALRHGSRKLPLGRYLQQQLRRRVGKEIKAPITPEYAEEMRLLREAQFSAPKASLKETVLQVNEGRRARLNARSRIYKKRTTL